MYFQPINTHTNASNHNRFERGAKSNAANNRSTQNRDCKQKAEGFQPQNSDLLQVLQQLIQNLLQQLQLNQDNPQDLKLSNEQRQRTASTLGVNPDSISINDTNKDGKVSTGDKLNATFTTDTGGTESLSRTIDAGLAADINGELTNPLNIDQTTAANIASELGLPTANGPVEIFDQDGSGSLSAGDVIKSVSYDPGGQGTPTYHTISTGDMQSLQDAGLYPGDGNQPPVAGQPLTLSSQQLANIDSVIASVSPERVSILDQDASGTVSEGDLFKATYIPETAQVTDFERTLNANDAAMINGEFGSLLSLTEDEKQPLRDSLNTPAERFEKVFDRDGSGTLSTGDVALGSFNGAFGGTPPPQFPTSYVTLEVTPDGEITGGTEG